jgi:hypothetical protein
LGNRKLETAMLPKEGSALHLLRNLRGSEQAKFGNLSVWPDMWYQAIYNGSVLLDAERLH